MMMSKFLKIDDKKSRLGNWGAFTFFLLLTLLFYYPTIGSGFTTDVTGGIERIENQPFINIFKSFGFPALNQISIFGFYAMYQIFGLAGLPWYLLFCFLHALNGYLFWQFFRKTLSDFNYQNAGQITFFSTLFFLICPYQSEVLVWRACLNYLLVTCFSLLAFLQLLQFLDTEKRKHLFLIHFFFVLALFTFELSLVVPLMLAIFYTVSTSFHQKTARISSFFTKITLPQIGLLIGYFFLGKITFGRWIGHYGAAVHLQFSIAEISANFLKYLLKYTLFVRSYSHGWKESIFAFCDQYGWVIVGTLVLFFAGFFYKKRLQLFKKNGLALLLFILFSLAIFPVLNVYFYWIQHVENDRYGYFAAAFLYGLIVLLIFRLPTLPRYFLIGIYLLVISSLLNFLNQNWKTSTTVFYSLLDDYRWHEAENVIILNVPDNYNGAYMFRIIGDGSGFADALQTVHNQLVIGQVREITQYNMVRPTDGVKAEKLSDNQLKVTFNQWGNWFWRNGVGVGPTHERADYKATFQGQFYILDLKKEMPNAVFIYQDGNQWKEVR